MNNYHNQDSDELIRTAEHEGNTLALAIADIEHDDNQELIDDMIDDTATHFASEIDDKLQAYIDDYYNNPESDYFDFLYESIYLTSEDIDKAFEDTELTSGMTTQDVRDKLDCMLDYYCEVEITHNYAAPKGIQLNGASIGEIEESIELITDDIPALYSDSVQQEKLGNAIMEKISAVYVHDKSEYIYIDMSDTCASLVLRADRLDELLAPEED
jgi:hypothetical protein